MAALLKMLAVVLLAVVPGGLVVLSIFILARIVAARIRAVEEGPDRYRRAFANLSLRDVWNETRRVSRSF